MDLISRQAAIASAISGRIRTLPTSEDGENWIRTAEVRQSLLDVPSAEVEPVKRGKWIYDNQFHWYRASCSERGYKRVTDIKAEKWNGWKYCPNCGARMDLEGEKE